MLNGVHRRRKAIRIERLNARPAAWKTTKRETYPPFAATFRCMAGAFAAYFWTLAVLLTPGIAGMKICSSLCAGLRAR
jgi:hypothetical protein